MKLYCNKVLVVFLLLLLLLCYRGNLRLLHSCGIEAPVPTNCHPVNIYEARKMEERYCKEFLLLCVYKNRVEWILFLLKSHKFYRQPIIKLTSVAQVAHSYLYRIQQNQVGIARSDNRLDHSETWAVLLNHLVDHPDMDTDFCLWVI